VEVGEERLRGGREVASKVSGRDRVGESMDDRSSTYHEHVQMFVDSVYC
jgi:hypothetical protein